MNEKLRKTYLGILITSLIICILLLIFNVGAITVITIEILMNMNIAAPTIGEIALIFIVGLIVSINMIIMVYHVYKAFQEEQ